MKACSVALQAHLAGDVTTLAVLWKVKRADGTIFGFTTHDEDIVYNDGTDTVTYQASTGFTNTAMAGKSDMSVDNSEVSAFLDASVITEDDIRAGLWNNAKIQIRLVNWADLTMGDLKIRSGSTGILKMSNGLATAEIRGLTQALTTVVGAQYGPLCRAELFSNSTDIDEESQYLCNLDRTLFSQTGSVSSSADAVTIVPQLGLKMKGSATPLAAAPAGWFNDGVLIFTSGVLNGFVLEVKSWDGTTLTMFLPMPYEPANSDTFTIEPGCDKRRDTCHDKFSNIVNFRGEPSIPGGDLIMLYPDAK